MFPEEGVEEIMNRVRESSCSEERSAIGSALMRNFGDIDMPRWFTDAGVPIRAVNAAAPNPTRIESNRQYADFDAVLMEGVGHYPHMTRPDQFNPLLLDAIAEILQEAP
jgi:pimeloyl-ACP methyl ester carboxylesterase